MKDSRFVGHEEPGRARKEASHVLRELIADITPEQIESAKKIFYNAADIADINKGNDREFRELFKHWVNAIEALPDIELLITRTNIMELEVTLDIIRKAKGI